MTEANVVVKLMAVTKALNATCRKMFELYISTLPDVETGWDYMEDISAFCEWLWDEDLNLPEVLIKINGETFDPNKFQETINETL